MTSFTKTYELLIASSDPSGDNNDVAFVSFFEIVGPSKKLIAQMQVNPHAIPIEHAAEFAADVASSLVMKAFAPA